MTTGRNRVGEALAALLVAAALAGCTAKAVAPLPPAPSVPPTTTTAIIDYSGVGIGAPAPGNTTTTIAIGPGRATLTGTVLGPEGPVPGAVVHAERLVGESVATVDVLSDANGAYSIPRVLGGRYRLRTWKPVPDNLALVEPLVFFLEGSETKRVDLTVRRYTGLSASAAIAPDPPIIENPSNLVVQVVNQVVDPGGIVRSDPVPGARVELFGSGQWRLLTPAVAGTDGGGRARWQLVCERVGNQPLSVVVGDTATFNLNLAGCTELPPPEPEAPGPGEPSPSPDEPAPTTTAPSPTSTTARPPASTSTTAPRTTTTAPNRTTTTTARDE